MAVVFGDQKGRASFSLGPVAQSMSTVPGPCPCLCPSQGVTVEVGDQ